MAFAVCRKLDATRLLYMVNEVLLTPAAGRRQIKCYIKMRQFE